MPEFEITELIEELFNLEAIGEKESGRFFAIADQMEECETGKITI